MRKAKEYLVLVSEDQRSWAKTFLSRPVVQNALNKVEQLGGANLVKSVLDSCYHAANFIDDDKQARQADSKFLREVAKMRATIQKLRKQREQLREECRHPMDQADIDVLYKLRDQYPWTPLEIKVSFIDNVLAALELSLDKPTAKKGPYLYRWKMGPLLYPDDAPLDNQKSQPHDVALNGLLFDLVFQFRCITARPPIACWQQGQPMPTEGQPNVPLAVELVNEALQLRKGLNDADAHQILFNLQKKGVGLLGWT